MYQSKQAGFTLLELMITVTVIAILAAIAVPMFGDYTKRGKITEAVGTLSDLRIRAERFYADNRTYVPGVGPLDWTAVAGHVGMPCILKDAHGGGWKEVYVCHSLDELIANYNVKAGAAGEDGASEGGGTQADRDGDGEPNEEDKPQPRRRQTEGAD